MKLISVIVLLVGVASALPGQSPASDSLEPRDECVNCVNYCCSTHGNCNYMTCSGSYCAHNGPGNAYCVCNCRYG
ncbi:hypothetical protein OQA88_6668 [Cercophora sp. LCS_1]